MSNIFAVQDRTGTVAQLVLDSHLSEPINVGDTGNYIGVQAWNGTTVTLPFAVAAINDPTDIIISTQNGDTPGNVLMSGWPVNGTIEWLTGENTNASPGETVVLQMVPANCYTTVDLFFQYLQSRNRTVSSSWTDEQIQGALVSATDYLDQKYRFKGIKLLQFLTNPDVDPLLPFIDPWLSPFGFTMAPAYFQPSTTDQQTQFPRQGCIDWNGDTVYGVPQIVQYACIELASRVLAGTNLQPDYDSNAVTQGAVIESVSQEIGPLRKTTVYDTKFGLGFFPDFPQVTRMLRSAGLLVAGGGATIIR